MATACKHPRVRVVSRHDDTEYVECQDCGEVFDSEEFRDMEIEETGRTRTQPGRLLKHSAVPWLSRETEDDARQHERLEVRGG